MVEVKKLRNRRGRAARRDSRKMALPQAVSSQINLKIPVTELLSENGLSIIEENTDVLLEEIGIEFRDDPEVLGIWKEAGADIKGNCVHFPRGLLKELIKTAPASFTQHARNPSRSLEIGGTSMIFAPVYGPPFVSEIENGRRYGTIDDFRSTPKKFMLLITFRRNSRAFSLSHPTPPLRRSENMHPEHIQS